jgi:homoserine kinase type II
MSVYTTIAPEELKTFLEAYDLGTLVEYQGIDEGIENTNYFVTTTQGQYVLTLFESIGFDDLPYYLDLMAFLAERGVQSPHPLPDRGGSYMCTFKDKPAALVQRLPGHSVASPTIEQCQAVGEALGHLHLEGRAFAGRRDHTRGPQWRQRIAERLFPHLNPEDAALLREELRFQNQHYDRTGLPWGVIHADLFRDNALFCGDKLTGILDFYYACNGVMLYDLAVTVNDWCIHADGSLEADKAIAILSAYHQQRPLQEREHAIWPVMLRVAALRFWLSRLHDQLFPRPGELTQIKDPNWFKNILREHVNNAVKLADVWV